MDALAKGGVRMTDGYCTAPQCVPSRGGLISGQYQTKWGLESNPQFQDAAIMKRFDELETIPERLQKAGYVTGMAGKWHLGPSRADAIAAHGFDKAFHKNSNGPGHWNMNLEGEDVEPQVQKGGGYHIDLISEFACSFIDRFHDKPFFFYLACRAPHVPLDAPQKYLDRFPGKMPERRRQALAMLSAVDDGVGQIMATLRKHELEEDTLIFVIGDNGAPLKIHKLDCSRWRSRLGRFAERSHERRKRNADRRRHPSSVRRSLERNDPRWSDLFTSRHRARCWCDSLLTRWPAR